MLCGSSGSALAFAAPVPPLALSWRKLRIARLCHCSGEYIKNTRILEFAGYPAEALIHLVGLLAGKLFDAFHVQHLEVPQHGWADRSQLPQLSRKIYYFHRTVSLDSLIAVAYCAC